MAQKPNNKSKFEVQLNLNHKEIKGKRAKMFYQDGKDHSENMIRNLKMIKRNYERKLVDLEDFHGNSTTSLSVTKDGFNSKSWIESMQAVKVELVLHNAQLKIAEATHNEWFNSPE
jgi:hypothetical protein